MTRKKNDGRRRPTATGKRMPVKRRAAARRADDPAELKSRLKSIAHRLKCPRFCILLQWGGDGRYYLQVAQGFAAAIDLEGGVAAGEGLLGEVIAYGRPRLIEDIARLEEPLYRMPVPLKGAALCLPLKSATDRVFGLLVCHRAQ